MLGFVESPISSFGNILIASPPSLPKTAQLFTVKLPLRVVEPSIVVLPLFETWNFVVPLVSFTFKDELSTVKLDFTVVAPCIVVVPSF